MICQDTANQLGNGKFQKNLFQEVSAALLRSLAPGRYAFIIGMQTPSFTPLGTLGYDEQVDMLTLMDQRAVVLLTIGITFKKQQRGCFHKSITPGIFACFIAFEYNTAGSIPSSCDEWLVFAKL